MLMKTECPVKIEHLIKLHEQLPEMVIPDTNVVLKWTAFRESRY